MSDYSEDKNKDALSCAQLLEILQEYLDGRLDELTAARAAEHLEACRRCGMEASIYQQIKEVLRQMAPEIPSDLIDRLERFAHRLRAGAGT